MVDKSRAAETLEYALQKFASSNIVPFNVSLHGGEVTTLPQATLEKLFTIISKHYITHYDLLTSQGFKKTRPHIKTNLYNFHKYYKLLDQFKVSVSGSIDLPLSLHAKYRTDKHNQTTLDRIIENVKLLSQYPHGKKLSATLFAEHISQPELIIRDIWTIHNEFGFDMNEFNFMFGFQSTLNSEKFDNKEYLDTSAISDIEQTVFYEKIKDNFSNTDLALGFRKNWFDEFTPSYCTSAKNCGEKFFLLQSDGDIYSCVRGQGVQPFFYGNLYKNTVEEILLTAKSSILDTHQTFGFNQDCQQCEYLHLCQTGCPYVKHERGQSKSYTCALQKAIYRDNPLQYPPLPNPSLQQQTSLQYARNVHPSVAFQEPEINSPRPQKSLMQRLPSDAHEEKNHLESIIKNDDTLSTIYSPNSFKIDINGDLSPCLSQLMKGQRTIYYLDTNDKIQLHMPASIFKVNCSEPITNSLYLQLLTDNKVVYGDEGREKQQHLWTHEAYMPSLSPSSLDKEWLCFDLSSLLHLYQRTMKSNTLNNLFFTTNAMRRYHYDKQKNNGFYHIQALNLPFQNIEFYWITH